MLMKDHKIPGIFQGSNTTFPGPYPWYKEQECTIPYDNSTTLFCWFQYKN